MAGMELLEPIDAGGFGYPQAAHLLNRAGFGGRPTEIVGLQQMGLDRAVDLMVEGPGSLALADEERGHFDPDIIQPEMDKERQALARAMREENIQEIQALERRLQERRSREMVQRRNVEQWWLGRMVASPWPLREKMTLMWHGHFPCRYRDVNDSYLMWQQNHFLRRSALGDYRELLQGVIEDPAMVRSLNNDISVKGSANEKMAGMVLEQFGVGEGYATDRDVRDAAKALTGYGINDNEMKYDRLNHDEGPKSVLGQRGNLDGKSLVKILLSHRAGLRRLAGMLYQQFVGGLGADGLPQAPAVVEGLGRLLTTGRYEIALVLKKLFKSKCFYDPAVMGRLVKSPGQVVAGTARILGTPLRDWQPVSEAMVAMGQGLFDPPLWGGWPWGGRWVNTTTLYARLNVCSYLITGKEVNDRQWAVDLIGYDPMGLLAGAVSLEPRAVVEHLVGTMIPQGVDPSRKEVLRRYMSQRKAVSSQAVLGLLLLITALPEYQLC